MASIIEDIRRLAEEQRSFFESEIKPLAEIAKTREFTPEEREQYEKLERTFDEGEERLRVLEQQRAVEERAFAFGTSLFAGGTDSRADAETAWRNLDTGEGAAISRDQSIRTHGVFERAAGRDSASDAEARYGSLGSMVRAMATGGTGSALVPTAWSADLIDLARSGAAVTQAGATDVPMEAGTVNIGRQTGDPTASFRAEGSAITASDPTFDSVTLSAKTLSAMVVATEEFWQDAPNADQIIKKALAEAMGNQIDLVALYGGITVGAGSINLPSPNPNPRGILAALNAVRPANVLGGAATNGTTPTVASGLWKEVLDAYFTVLDGNEEPTAAIWSSKLARPYAQAVDTTGQPVQVPATIEQLPRYVVNKIPSYTKGTSTTATDLFTANFKQLLIGQRLQITLRPLDQLFAGEGKIGVVASWRGDIAFARPSAFSVYRALNGAA